MSDDNTTTPVDPSTFLSEELRELWRRFADGVEALGAARPDVNIHTNRMLLRGQKTYVKANRRHMITYPTSRCKVNGDGDGITFFGKPCDEGVYQNRPTLRED